MPELSKQIASATNSSAPPQSLSGLLRLDSAITAIDEPDKRAQMFLLSPEQIGQGRSVSRPNAFSQAQNPKIKSRTTSHQPNLEDLPAEQRNEWVVPRKIRNPVVRGVELCRHSLPPTSMSLRFIFALPSRSKLP